MYAENWAKAALISSQNGLHQTQMFVKSDEIALLSIESIEYYDRCVLFCIIECILSSSLVQFRKR